MEERFQQPKDWQWKTITERGGLNLRTGSLVRHEQPFANLVLGPGMREFGEKYFETIVDFSNRDYNIYLMNWMGQGGSESILPGKFHRVSGTFGFDNDAQSLVDFTDNHVPNNAPKVYIGHSTGGLIGLTSIVKSPQTFAAGVQLAPFLGFFDKRAKFLEATLKFLKLSPKNLERYTPGGRNWIKRSDPRNSLKPQDYSSHPIRMSLSDEWTEANRELRVGDLTLGGFLESCRAIAFLEQPGIAEGITIPTMLVSAGQERIVNTTNVFNMATRIPNAIHTHLENAHHETLMERDDIRSPLITSIDGFFRTKLG